MNLDHVLAEVDEIRIQENKLNALKMAEVPTSYGAARLHVNTIEQAQADIDARWATLRAVVEDAAPAARPRKRHPGVVAAVRVQIQEWVDAIPPADPTPRWWRDWAVKRKLNPASVAKAARVEMAKARAAAEAVSLAGPWPTEKAPVP